MKKHFFKILFFPLFIFLAIQSKAEEMQIPFYKQNSHFLLFCVEQDHNVGDLLLDAAEKHFEKLSKDFNCSYDTQIKMMIYPNITAFHEAIGYSSAPDWLVACSEPENHMMLNVSPNSPGSVHNFESIFRVSRVNVTKLFIYENFQNFPRWLSQGVAFLEANYFIRPVVKEWLLDVTKKNSKIPSLKELESIKHSDSIAFSDIDGFRISYSLVEFINEKWGWNKILELLSDYSSFEKILGLSKETFRTEWINFAKNKYLNEEEKNAISNLQ